VSEPPKLGSRIEIGEDDRRWPLLFEREAARIASALGDRVVAEIMARAPAAGEQVNGRA
jgi:hypothetical protein